MSYLSEIERPQPVRPDVRPPLETLKRRTERMNGGARPPGPSAPRIANRRWLLTVLGVAAVYVITGRVGLKLDAVNGFAAIVWPPTGIALASLLMFGLRCWPGVALGAFIVNA